MTENLEGLTRSDLRTRVQLAGNGGTWTASATKGDLVATIKRGQRCRENGALVDARGRSAVQGATEAAAAASGSSETASAIADAIAGVLAAQTAQPDIDVETIQAIAKASAQEWAEEAGLDRPVEYVLPDGKALGKVEGAKHARFDAIARAFRGNAAKLLMLVGPTGSGKTFMSGQLAEAFGLPYFALSCSGGMSEAWIVGRVVITGDYVSTPFVDMWRNGGVILVDEIAAMPADVAILLNAALDNGKLLIPCTGEVIERHPDCYIVAADNGWGRTYSSEYTARQPLDYATVNRFSCCRYTLDYDRRLERKIARSLLPENGAADAVLDCLWALRKAQTKLGIERFAVATRQVAGFAVAIANGSQDLEALVGCLVEDLEPDERARLFDEAGTEARPWKRAIVSEEEELAAAQAD